MDVAISAMDGADYDVAGQSPSEQFLTWRVKFSYLGTIIVVDDPDSDTFYDFVDTGVPWTTGAYKTLLVCDNPAAGTTDYFYDGVPFYSQVTRLPATRVEQVVLVSDNFHIMDVGDFDNLSLIPGIAPACTSGSTCGNDIREPGEQCDGTDAPSCPTLCRADCTCPPPICGNDIKEAGEECDGSDANACPGDCLADCTCPCVDFEQTVDCSGGPYQISGDPSGEADDCSPFVLGPEHIYKLIVTEAGSYSFDMCGSAPGGDACASDSLLWLSTGCCDDVNGFAFDDDSCPCGVGFSFLECVPLDPDTYYLHVDYFSSPPATPYVVDIYCCGCGNGIKEPGEQCDGSDSSACPGQCSALCTCPAIAEDECEGRIPILCDSNGTADNCVATTGPSDPIPSCTTGDNYGSVFFSFVATDTSARIRTDLNSVAGDSGYGVYRVNQAAPCDEAQWTEIGCSEDESQGPDYNGDICVQGLIPGDLYVIMLISWTAADCGSYTVDITCPCPAGPANDRCPGTSIACGQAFSGQTTLGAANDYDDTGVCTGFSQGGPDVAYQLVLSQNCDVTIDITNPTPTYDPSVYVLTNCANPTACVAGADVGFSGDPETLMFSAAPGTYFIIVDGFFSGGGDFDISVLCPCAPPPPGACCTPGAIPPCLNGVTQADCSGANQQWTEGVLCSQLNPPCAPPPPTGSCCISGGCTQTTQSNCSGTWSQGGSCTPNPCPQPMGACCVNGGCTLTSPASCSGSYSLGGACSPNPCPQPTGACCNTATGGCNDGVTQANCAGAAQQWNPGSCAGLNPPCSPTGAIPAVSEWGLIVLTLLLLAGLKVRFGRPTQADGSAASGG